MNTIITSIELLFENYGVFMAAGVIGAIAYRAKNIMHWTRFVKSIIVSLFVSVLLSIIVKNFTDFSTEVIFVCGAIGSFFSADILRELSEIIDYLSDFVKEKLGKKSEKKEELNQEPTPEA